MAAMNAEMIENAQNEARSLVADLKSSYYDRPVFEGNGRDDGRSWVAATGRGGREQQL